MSATQRVLDSSSLKMPDFKGVGFSLRKELNEDGGDYNLNSPTTPDLIIEEDEESDVDNDNNSSASINDDEMTSKQSKPIRP